VVNNGGYKKNINQGLSVLLINNFGQQHLNVTAKWSATEGGQVLPTLSTYYLWGIDTAVPYCSCILIPLQPVVGSQTTIFRESRIK
jgi:hypothetical protein